jgi:hypothetical protein
MKIRPVGAELLRADRCIKKQTVPFRNFANAPKNWLLWPISGNCNATGVAKVRVNAGRTAGNAT